MFIGEWAFTILNTINNNIHSRIEDEKIVEKANVVEFGKEHFFLKRQPAVPTNHQANLVKK